MIILNHLPKLQTQFFLPIKPKPHLTPSLLQLPHFPIFSLFSSLSPTLPPQNPKPLNPPSQNPPFNDHNSQNYEDDYEEEPHIDVSLDKLFVPPETDISSSKSSSSSSSKPVSSVRILKGSNIVLSKYASNAQVMNAEFVKSSVSTEDCPADGLPEFALVGRSNVGKSSLLNSLVRRKKLALTSKKPGKTQCINHFRINDSWYLVDLPGYGYDFDL